MIDPKIKTEVVHSTTKPAYNVIGKNLGGKYKIARVPYVPVEGAENFNAEQKREALEHAEFISWCFNNSTEILTLKIDPNNLSKSQAIMAMTEGKKVAWCHWGEGEFCYMKNGEIYDEKDRCGQVGTIYFWNRPALAVWETGWRILE